MHDMIISYAIMSQGKKQVRFRPNRIAAVDKTGDPAYGEA
jgi:hypothetical protein